MNIKANKHIETIIREEIEEFNQDLLNVEGVGDKYAEKQFNIPDPSKTMNSKAIANMDNIDPPMGKLIGRVVNSPVFLNPHTLKDFEPEVRALSDKNNNLFVAQANGYFAHYELGVIIKKAGFNIGKSAYDDTVNITWLRIKNSNIFGFADSMESYVEDNTIHYEDAIKRTNELQSKHNEFKFVPKVYWKVKENESIAETIIKEEYMNMNNITLWHGSTKKFDDFDMSMVGSGDQNSLGGWGIYFSDNKDVSMRYFLPSGQIRQYRLQSGEYFDLDNPVDQGETSRMFKMLKRLNVSEKDLAEFDENYIHTDYPPTNKNLYDWLSYVLKSEKNASLFLEKLNYIGNTMEDRWEKGAKNYIVFNLETIMGEVDSGEYNDNDSDEYNPDNDNDDENN